MYPNSAYSGISVINSIFYKNSGVTSTIIYSTPAFRTSASISMVTNCIIWGNTGPYMFSGGTIYGNYCLQQPESEFTGTTNTYADPQFTNAADPDGPDNVWGTEDDGLQPGYCSPAIDYFPPSGIVSPDMLGRPLFNNLKDVGCYERQTPSCQVYSSAEECQSLSITDVKQRRWYRFYTSDGIIAEINPNDLDLGTVTVSVSDPSDAISYNDHKFLGRSINITSSKYASGVTMPDNYKLRLYYPDTELAEYNTAVSGTFTLADLNMAWKDGGTGCVLASYGGNSTGFLSKASITHGQHGPNDNGFYLEFSLNHFTIFATTTSGSNPLPVTLVSFTGKNLGGYNLLQWQTTSETNNDHFEIERSTNAATFEKIGEQIPGAGNSNSLEKYSFRDATFSPGTNYYRLKQVDNDGKYSYSRTIAITNELTQLLYPNPVKDELFIDAAGKSFSYKITDVNGQIVKSGISKTKTAIPANSLATGIYFISFENQTLRFLKE